MHHQPWVAVVQDPCILGLDFLRSTGCQLDLAKTILSFPGGEVVNMNAPYLMVSSAPSDSSVLPSKTMQVCTCSIKHADMDIPSQCSHTCLDPQGT